MDYNNLDNLPTMNGVTVQGNLKLEDVGIIELTPEMVSELWLEVFGSLL
jgi:hypothetical protein